jgi:uncharacterized protein (DUF1697 family)
MAVWIALLRGVNVGGHNRIAMAQLRALAEDLGHTKVRTYIQSGNLVFESRARSAARIGRALEERMTAVTGVESPVVVRSRDELASVASANPFLARGEDVAKLHVVFLSRRGDPAKLASMDPSRYAPDEVRLVGREVYVYAPNGIGRSKLGPLGARMGLADGTMRNWRTVTTLLEMADEIG